MDKIDEGLGRMMGDALRGVTNSKEKKGRKGTKSYKVGQAVRKFGRGLAGKDDDTNIKNKKKKRLSTKIKKRVGRVTPSAHGVGKGLRRMTTSSIKGVKKAGKSVADFKRGALKQKSKDRKHSVSHKAGRGARNFVRGLSGARDDSRGAVKGDSKAHKVGSSIRDKVKSLKSKKDPRPASREEFKKWAAKRDRRKAKGRAEATKERMSKRRRMKAADIRNRTRKATRGIPEKMKELKKKMAQNKSGPSSKLKQ